MSCDREMIDFLLEQMEGSGKVSARKMFGEYGIYCDNKLVALVCDNRLYVKPTRNGENFIGTVVKAPPYPGAREYFLITDQIEDSAWLCGLIQITAAELKEKDR